MRLWLIAVQWCVEWFYVWVALPMEQGAKSLYVWLDDQIDLMKYAPEKRFMRGKKGPVSKK
tara:strand:+ start:206 stop:388 length:183 start_codon:yes stop_codon:yes gene_type:complete